jgi:hypothetical protein
MRCNCPHCAGRLIQTRNLDGPNYCTNCQKLFFVPAIEPVPTWVFGVLAFLVVNWQIIYWQ